MTAGPGPASEAARLEAAISRLGRVRRVLVAVDFDGVLAEIVLQREAARPLPASIRALERLSVADRTHVAIVSGRELADLMALANPSAAMTVVASHGAEVAGVDLRLSPGQVTLRHEVIVALEAISSRHPGTVVETKPTAAVLHTRLAERDVALSATAAALLGPALLPGAHPIAGKEVVEIRVVDRTKGDALAALGDQLRPDAILYVGDDVTDEDAFAVLGPDDVGVKVGPGATLAGYQVKDPRAVARVLTSLADARAPSEAPG